MGSKRKSRSGSVRGQSGKRDMSPAAIERRRALKLIHSYVVRDSSKGLRCDLDADWLITHVLRGVCFYCGDSVRLGCDRVDNSLGHLKSNVVACCRECNVARSNNFSVSEMQVIGSAIRAVKLSRK